MNIHATADKAPLERGSSFREMLELADRLHDRISLAHSSDSMALALQLADAARRQPATYKALSAVIRDSFLSKSGAFECDAIALGLACQSFSLEVRNAHGLLIRLFNVLSLHRLIPLFSNSLKENRVIFVRFLEWLINGEFPGDLSRRALFRLSVIAYVHAPCDVFKALMVLIYRECCSKAVDSPKAVESSLLRVSAAHLSRPCPAPQTMGLACKESSRLRIALCVSGQMRAYRTAWPTWKNLKIFEHEVDVFVHTWRSVGWRIPNPINGNGAARAFGYVPFIRAFVRCGALFGKSAIELAYPKLFEAVSRDCGEVTEQDLYALYGRSSVVIEDDSSERFGVDPGNQRKMFCKIRRAHEMARKSGVDYDLIIRIRPDRLVLPPLGSVDLHELACVSKAERCIFGEPARITGGQYVDDQFAIGVPEVMDCYARTLEVHDQANKEKWFGFTPDLIPHLTLANSLFFQGVRVEPLRGIRLGPIAGDAPLSREAIHELLMRDVGSKPRHRMDQILLESLS